MWKLSLLFKAGDLLIVACPYALIFTYVDGFEGALLTANGVGLLDDLLLGSCWSGLAGLEDIVGHVEARAG